MICSFMPLAQLWWVKELAEFNRIVFLKQTFFQLLLLLLLLLFWEWFAQKSVLNKGRRRLKHQTAASRTIDLESQLRQVKDEVILSGAKSRQDQPAPSPEEKAQITRDRKKVLRDTLEDIKAEKSQTPKKEALEDGNTQG